MIVDLMQQASQEHAKQAALPSQVGQEG
jgi:hypothetical protein